MKVFLDNAATTPIDQEVLDTMIPVMRDKFGNPSSIHSFGREVRAEIEKARKQVANYLNVSPGEIFFTSGGTEANNMAICGAAMDLGIKHFISSPIEHHAVLHTLENLKARGIIDLDFVNLTENGHVDYAHLVELLKKDQNQRSFVSLMYANNEIGNLLEIERVGEICNEFNAIFHSDTVQAICHYPIDLQKLNVHFITCSAHKFHGPKGIGFLYINGDIKIKPFIHGGAQERNMRGGTENVYGIVGLAKAFEVAYRDMDAHRAHIAGLKEHMIRKLEQEIPGVGFNGDAKGNSLYTVLNVCFPPTDKAEMLLFNLDIAGIAASGGSACTSGSDQGSHVLRGIGANIDRPSIRFSFSKYNTIEEIDYCVGKLKEMFAVEV